jgi:hypothetical protein
MPPYLKIPGLLLLVFLISGCSGKPEIPPLSSRETKPIDRILLRGTLTPKDFRQLYRELNQNGKLNALKPWIEEASDEELNVTGSLVRQYFYADAYQQGSLRSLLDFRNLKKGFSSWLQTVLQTPAVIAAMPIFSLNDFPALLLRDTAFLSPQFYETTLKLKTNTKMTVPPKELAEEALRFLMLPENQTNLISLSESLQRSKFGESFLGALSSLREKYKGDLAFKGFARAIKTHLNPNRNDWDKILNLAQLLNRPSNGMFLEAHEKLLVSNDLARQLETELRPRISNAIAADLRRAYLDLEASFWQALPRKNPNDPPSANFGILFARTQERLESFISQESAEKEPFLYQRRIFLNTVIICEWLEKFAAENPAFSATLEKGTFNFPDFIFELREEKGLSQRLTRDLIAVLGEKPAVLFLENLEKFLSLSEPGETTYKTTKLEGMVPFAIGLRSAIRELDDVLSFGDPTPLFATWLNSFTNPSHPLSFSLATFETDPDGSMLRAIHCFLGGLKHDAFERLFHLLFEEMEIGRLSESNKLAICGLFPSGSENARYCRKVLDNLKILAIFHEKKAGLPALTETYHAVLRKTAADDSGGVEDLFTFFSSSQMFASPNKTPLYPTVFQFFQNEDLVTELLSRYSHLKEDEQKSFLKTLSQAIEMQSGVSGTALHLKALQELNTHYPQETRSLFTYAIENGWGAFPGKDTFTFPERDWTLKFVGSHDAERLWTFLRSHGTSQSHQELVRELEKLAVGGAFEETFVLLSQAQDERTRLIATTLLNWERSGELLNFLKTLKTLIGG